MKTTGQGKKEYVVMKFDDYENIWKQWSVPVTINQATKILLQKHEHKFYKMELIKNVQNAK